MSKHATIRCAACGEEIPADAAFCAMCGGPVLDEGDPLANSVAGSAAPQEPASLRQGLDEARGRLEALLPEVAATLAERAARWPAILDPARRPARTRRQALNVLHSRWRARGNRPRQGLWWRGLGIQLGPPASRWQGMGRQAPPLGQWWPALMQQAMLRQTRPMVAPPLPARIVWFVFAGSWLTCLWIIATWLAICSVAGRVVAARMLDLVPSVLTLRPIDQSLSRQPAGFSLIPLPRQGVRQHDPATRAAYFVFVGWWASLVWMILAYACSLTAIGIPLGYRMFALTPTVAHLERR